MTDHPTLFACSAGDTGPPSGSAGFDRFWEAYPRKVGKLDARRAWCQLADERPPTRVVVEKLSELKDTEQWREAGGRFVPYPATWLRRGGWADEVQGGVGKTPAWEETPEPTYVRCTVCRARVYRYDRREHEEGCWP